VDIPATEAMRCQSNLCAHALGATVKEIADKIISKSQVAIQMAKAAINKRAETDLEKGTAYESELFSMLFSTEDQKEGMESFLEKTAI